MANATFIELRAQLDELADRGRSYLRRYALVRAVEHSLPETLTALLAVPGLFLAAALIGRIGGPDFWPFTGWQSAVITILFALGYFVLRSVYRYLTVRIDRRIALALFDRKLGFKDRIQAADEFSARDNPRRFQMATIQDAEPYVQRALDARLEAVKVARPEFNNRNWQHAAAAMAVLLLALVVDTNRTTLGIGSTQESLQTVIADALTAAEPAATESADAAERRESETLPAAPEKHRQANNKETSEEFTKSLQRANDASGAWSSSDRSGASGGASQQSRSDNAAASASGQGSSAQQERKDREPSARKPSDSDRRPAPDPEENNESSSGITGGKGSSSGSRTASSDKQAADNKAQRDDSEDDAYDDAEDEEDEEQDAAAAARPLLNQRKAPVDRSLVPSGAGPGRENPDTNGRGGPGGLKKARGVAAMLLGVPMPDQLRGQANPGRMKVQRERSEPEEKFVGEQTAEQRGAIDETTGLIAHQGLAPWLKDVVRDYFLAERQQNTTESE